MKLGVTLPLSDIGGGPAMVRLFANAAEAAGYDHLATPRRCFGGQCRELTWLGARNTSTDLFYDPFVLFGFLGSCCTTRFGFSTQVLILHQRQTLLVAKQAACLNVLSGGRFRLRMEPSRT
jgi:alkanesulfonate monooxygenase SsuD/methylene tetrahydromethanopterin reductase-like flavin-dependent oxidoreductase (luciferase family)